MQMPIPQLPIALPQNAVFSVPVYSGGLITDPDTGNQTQEVTTITVYGYLQRLLDKVKSVNLPGLDTNETTFEGYILSTEGRQYIKQDMKVPCTIVSPDPAIPSQVGEFRFITVVHPHAATLQGIGLPIEGAFKQIGGQVT